MKITSHHHKLRYKSSIFNSRWIAPIRNSITVAAVLGLALLHSTAIGNPAARNAEFIDLLDNNNPRALEMLRSAIADPTAPGSADILHSAVLSESTVAQDLITAVTPDLPLAARMAVHSAFAELGDTRLESDLRALAESVDQVTLQMLLPLFIGVGTKDSLPFLLSQTDLGDVVFRNRVAAVIVRLDLAEFDHQLLKRITSSSGEERLQAIRLAGIRNPVGTEERLLDLLKHTDCSETRSEVLASLERSGKRYESAQLLLQMITTVESVTDARPYQVVFRRLTPRVEDISLLWNDGFIPAWESVESIELRNALLLMLPAMRGNESANFLIQLIKSNDDLRNAAIAQLTSWNEWDAAQYVLTAISLDILSESQRGDFFNQGRRLLSRRIHAPRDDKQAFANRLLEAAPTEAIKKQVREAIVEGRLSL